MRAGPKQRRVAMTKGLKRLVLAYRQADPRGEAAAWMEDDAKSQQQFAESADQAGDEKERDGCLELARQSKAGAALLRAVLRMRCGASTKPSRKRRKS